MIEQQNPHDPLPGEHQANDIGNVDWQKHNEGRVTLHLKHPSNRSHKDVQKIL